MKYLVLFLLTVWTGGLLATELVSMDAGKQNLMIAFVSEKGKKITVSEKKTWTKLCDRLGKGLVVDSPQGGAFANYRCLYLSAMKKPAKEDRWWLYIVEKAKSLDIEISYHNDGEKYLVQSFRFEFKGNFLKVFTRDSSVINLAHLIIESLPLGSSINYTAADKPITLPVDGVSPEPLPSLMVYQLDFDPSKEMWIPQLRSRVVYDSTKGADAGPKQAYYKEDQSWWPLVPGKRYWVQNAEGRNKRQAIYQKRLANDLGGFSILNLVDSLIFESLNSNYAGFRYGRSLKDGDSAISHVSIVSLLMEMRSGPLAGLRWYYDLTPAVERKLEVSDVPFKERFEMRRASLGWAFNFNMPAAVSSVVSHFDVQPKLGLLDMDYRSVAEDSNDIPQPVDFRAKNIMSFSLELGLEHQSSWLLNRLWVSFASAKFGLKNPDGVSVISTKVGFDNYFDVFTLKRIKVGLLAFGLMENIGLARDPNRLDPEAAVKITDISFNLFYLGGGLTLSW